MSSGGGVFTPDGAYYFVWDSVRPMTGKYAINYFQYQEDVVCLHAGWLVLAATTKLKGKCRCERWEVYLCGDMTIKVVLAQVQFLDSGDMPVVVTTGHGVQTCRKLRRSPQLQFMA